MFISTKVPRIKFQINGFIQLKRIEKTQKQALSKSTTTSFLSNLLLCRPRQLLFVSDQNKRASCSTSHNSNDRNVRPWKRLKNVHKCDNVIFSCYSLSLYQLHSSPDCILFATEWSFHFHPPCSISILPVWPSSSYACSSSASCTSSSFAFYHRRWKISIFILRLFVLYDVVKTKSVIKRIISFVKLNLNYLYRNLKTRWSVDSFWIL